MKVVVGASSFAAQSNLAMLLLEEKGIEVIKNPYGRRLTEEETIKHLQGADGILAGLEPLNENVLSQCPDLKAIARIGIGMDNVDFEATKRHGIKVSNTPNGPTDAVAEMSLAALLCILHQIIPSNNDIHNGIWKKRNGGSINGLKVFLIGYGYIGKKTAKLFEKLGAEIKVYDKYQENISSCTLHEGLEWAEVISLHASGKDEILGDSELSHTQNGCIILNSARGTLINEEALYKRLKTKEVSWFWADALWEEPYSGKIAECDNAILTPHISTYTKKCREEMETQAAKNLLEDLGYDGV